MVHVCVNAINAILIHRCTTINDTLFIKSNEIFKNNKFMQMILRLLRRQWLMVEFLNKRPYLMFGQNIHYILWHITPHNK